MAQADIPPPDTSILTLCLKAFEGLSEEGVSTLARASAASGHLITLILAQEHLRRRLLRQSHVHWWQYATGGTQKPLKIMKLQATLVLRHHQRRASSLWSTMGSSLCIAE